MSAPSEGSTRDEFLARLQHVIPGGAHTYSRGRDQFPANAPAVLTHGKGAYVWDPDGTAYLDYGMGLRSVALGYGYPSVTEAVMRACEGGINLTLPSVLELEVAELIVARFPSIDMVKFARHGSVSVTAAVRLARAATGRDAIAVCRQHPFHSFDDWFIGSTPMNRGTAKASQGALLFFDYGDGEALAQLLQEHGDRIAAIILEPGTDEIPCPRTCAGLYCLNGVQCHQQVGNFLHVVRTLCDQHGIVMILDEVISAFRWDAGGAQAMFGVKPDLTILGKALGNGFAISALGGAAKYMELGGISPPGAERVFLLSTTHGSEAVGLAAAGAVLEVYSHEPVCDHLRAFGSGLLSIWQEAANRHGLGAIASLSGPPFSLSMHFCDANGQPSSELRTLFQQEMVRKQVLMPWIAPSLSHSDVELEITADALDSAFGHLARALDGRVSDFLLGEPTKPVFRRFN